jgi:hypothetical protein
MILHRHDESDNLQDLLYTDYGFHMSLMSAAIVLAYRFISIARSRMREGSPLTERAAGDPNSGPVGQTPEPNATRFVSSGALQAPVLFRRLAFRGR